MQNLMLNSDRLIICDADDSTFYISGGEISILYFVLFQLFSGVVEISAIENRSSTET